jgi:hypothetical protein
MIVGPGLDAGSQIIYTSGNAKGEAIWIMDAAAQIEKR